jgi:hypothetical protein
MDQELASSTLPLPMEYNRQLQAGSANRAGVKRITSTVYANQNTQIVGSTDSSINTANKTIRFLIPPQGFLDGKSSYLVVKAQIDHTGATANSQIIFNPYTESWIQRITIKTPQGVVIEDLESADVLGSIMRRKLSKNYKNALAKSCLNNINYMNPLESENMVVLTDTPTTTGYNKLVSALSAKQANFNYYIIELRASDFWNADNYHPLKAMSLGNSNAFQLEVQFKEVAGMTMSLPGFTTPNTATQTYRISDYYLMCDFVIDPSKEEEIQEAIKSNPILFHYKQWRHYNNTLSAGSSQNTLLVTEFQQSLQEIITVFRPSTNIDNVATDGTLFWNPGSTITVNNANPENASFSVGMQQYFTKVGNDYYPLQKVDSSANTSINFYEMYKGLQKNKKYYDGDDSLFVNDAGQTSDNGYDFMIDTSFRVYPDDSAGVDQDFSSGINTKGNPQAINIIMTTTSIPVTPGNIQADHYTHFDSSLVIMSNETYVVS